jgi:hypothetical protein
MNKEASGGYAEAAYRFGDAMFDALNVIGEGSKFHRLLVV